MSAAEAIWDAISGFLKAVNAILSVVPGLVWAIALVAALVHGWWVAGERDVAVKAKNEAIGALQELQGAVAAQKKAAGELLKALTDKVLAQQAELNDRHKAQEIRDANNQATIDRQAARLRVVSRDAGGLGLRDPNATGCRSGGGSPEGGSPAVVGGGADNQSQAPGLLSVQLERLLLRLTGEADAVNRAYESCRADALSVRGLPPEPPPLADPAAPAAPSKGSVP